jgi:polysaccharide deacetylase family protein (PEP-CTERM system associated)
MSAQAHCLRPTSRSYTCTPAIGGRTEGKLAPSILSVNQDASTADSATRIRRASAAPRHLLTVAVEDHFHASAFRGLVRSDHWDRFERRVEHSTRQALALFDEFDVKATFFTLGWVAERVPRLIREIVDRGHEVASKGYFHRSLAEMGPDEFRRDLRRARAAIEDAAGVRVDGYRIARGRFGPKELWALDMLVEEGYAYDSSFYPRGRLAAGEQWQRFAFVHRHAGGELHEIPLSTWGWQGWTLPIGGGAYMRHLPHRLTRRLVEHRVSEHDAPLALYFHAWELDRDLPRITAAPRHAQLRQYRNLEKMPWRLRYYLRNYRFGTVREHLGLSAEPVLAAPTAPQTQHVGGASERPPLTLVVPCYNEARVLQYLANTLRQLEAEFADEYSLRYVFVDDCSSDATWQELHNVFGAWPACRLVRHETNRGVAAAIRTGIERADTTVVCSIDCDCSYDPRQLRAMLPLLADDVAVVTASPYHPMGEVRNVPGWRLLLSKGLSMLYRRVFRQKLYTYTACFRAYRRELVCDIELSEGGYLGLAELLIKLDRRGRRIVESPAVLEVRLLGHSKMKALRTIRGHLRMLGQMLVRRGHSPMHPGSTPANDGAA